MNVLNAMISLECSWAYNEQQNPKRTLLPFEFSYNFHLSPPLLHFNIY